jgi:hypothetical protein
MPTENDAKSIVRSSRKDAVWRVGKVASSVSGAIIGTIIAVPGLGAGASELYGAIFKQPLTKRMENWMISVDARLRELEYHLPNFDLRSLSGEPTFISIFMQAFQLAIRNHQEEKLEALRNVVINAARPDFPEDDIYMMFVNWIDAFIPWHIKILCFVDNLDSRQPGKSIDMVCNHFPELRNDRPFAIQIIRELIDRGLINETGENVLEDEVSLIPPSTTSIGKKFLKFIS